MRETMVRKIAPIIEEGIPALQMFSRIVSLLREEAQGDDVCWLWPDRWPLRWSFPHEGFDVRQNDMGYGQFVMLQTETHMQKTSLAHRLSFSYTNYKLDPRLVSPYSYPPETTEWLNPLDKHYARYDGKSVFKQPVVRHSVQCSSKSCINPFHLDFGTASMNQLDTSIANHAQSEISSKANGMRGRVISDFDDGCLVARELAFYSDIDQWEAVRILKDAGYPWNVLLHDFGES